jgi:Protein of unknown function (DUF3237)
MNLAPEFTYRVKTEGPLPETKGSPRGERQYWIVTEAQLEGPRMNAELAVSGSDWMNVSNNGFWRPDVRCHSSPTTTKLYCSITRAWLNKQRNLSKLQHRIIRPSTCASR